MAPPSPVSPAAPGSTGTATPTPTTGATLPAPGNPDGRCAVPEAAQAVRVASADRVVGTGTPASCTGEAVVNAVAQGGHIGFNCGPDPVTIVMSRTAKVFNNRPNVVLDGGGKVTLSGAGRVRILYQNTCDAAQVWTTASCDRQTSPQLTVQNLSLVNGNATGQTYGLPEVQGGGAVYARGGALRIVNSRFVANQCEPAGQDLGGGAVRAFGVPTSISHSTFGGAAGEGNMCANGGAVSGLGSSLSIYNSAFSDNRAVGTGANAGTPGGGNGGAIYQDGNAINLSLCGSNLERNQANEGGSAVFFVSNDLSGAVSLADSRFSSHPFGRFETNSSLWPGLFVNARQMSTAGSTFAR